MAYSTVSKYFLIFNDHDTVSMLMMAVHVRSHSATVKGVLGGVGFGRLWLEELHNSDVVDDVLYCCSCVLHRGDLPLFYSHLVYFCYAFESGSRSILGCLIIRIMMPLSDFMLREIAPE